MITGNDILLYLSYKYKSNWEGRMEAIKRRDEIRVEEIKGIKDKVKSKYVTMVDKEYPEYLKTLGHPPFVLFYKGDLNLLSYDSTHRLSVVGSRKCSSYGVDSTKSIIDGLPKDFLIISGLAHGIDSVSHESALRNNLKTVAVLGDGLERIYPASNKELSENILKNGGLLISEYFDDVEAKPEYFVNRNRIIAVLCNFLLVSEAYEKSGTSITVNYALSYGKDVGCIPYEIKKGSICNTLLKDGAYLIEDADDIVRVIH